MLVDEHYRGTRFWRAVHAIALGAIVFFRRDFGIYYLRGTGFGDLFPLVASLFVASLLLSGVVWLIGLSSLLGVLIKVVAFALYSFHLVCSQIDSYRRRGTNPESSGDSLLGFLPYRERIMHAVIEPGITMVAGLLLLTQSLFSGLAVIFLAGVFYLKEWHSFHLVSERGLSGDVRRRRSEEEVEQMEGGRQRVVQRQTLTAAPRAALLDYIEYDDDPPAPRAPARPAATAQPVLAAAPTPLLPESPVSALRSVRSLPEAERERHYLALLELPPWGEVRPQGTHERVPPAGRPVPLGQGAG